MNQIFKTFQFQPPARTPFVPRSYPVRTPFVPPSCPPRAPLVPRGTPRGTPRGNPPRTSGYPHVLPLGYPLWVPLRSSRGTPPIAYGLRELPRASYKLLNLSLTSFLLEFLQKFAKFARVLLKIC